VITEHFSLGLMAETRPYRLSVDIGVFLKRMGHLKSKFYVEDVRFEPTSVYL